MKSADIRESFLSYFEDKGCVRRPSSSLIPEDPSLLLTTAGMVQFKPVFLGVKDLGFSRATTVQKCVRTTDIDIIGTTGRHHSFFEMLGNFSFGDYFKREAIRWSWEYSTDVLGLDPDRIWATIYEDDDESLALWLEESGVPAERIVRLGAKDNFWSAGPTGPCGPCSELYYDQGPEVSCGESECAPGCDCDRYLEYWNLVFMQYDRKEDGSLEPLPKQNIDTGMGLERIAAILQGVPSNFETDNLRELMSLAEEISGKSYGADARNDTSLRIIADHARAVTFMIADGILPSNEGRGYVLRRLLRRAVRHGRLLGVTEPFMTRLTDTVVAQMGGAYPELVEHAELISGIVSSEEERFGATLRQGMIFLEDELERLGEGNENTLDGKTAFALHDTYGFPLELTAEIVAERGFAVDTETFEVEMEAQRERGRAGVKDDSWKAYGGVFSEIVADSGPTESLCYVADEASATVLGIVVDGASVDEAAAGVEAQVVLDRSPFYPEQGGQVGDEGTIRSSAAAFDVTDTTAPMPGVVSHVGVVSDGALRVGDSVDAAIDVMRRERIRRNHTATHVLHWALRLVLGDHVRQGGSLVAPDRLRFDFTHFEALTPQQVEKVERLVNAKIFENHPVKAYETSLASAREAGVTALFGEKYGDFVRVLEVGAFSKELCGGTHISATTEIGLFKIVTESSVGANLRRIEAVTSYDAYEYTQREERELVAAAAELKVQKFDVDERIRTVLAKLKDAELRAERRKETLSTDVFSELEPLIVDVGYKLLAADLGEADQTALRASADVLRARMGGGAVVLAGRDPESGKAILLAAGADDALDAGFNAGALVREMAEAVGGRGGGKPAMAQAGGPDADGIEAALDIARRQLGAE